MTAAVASNQQCLVTVKQHRIKPSHAQTTTITTTTTTIAAGASSPFPAGPIDSNSTSAPVVLHLSPNPKAPHSRPSSATTKQQHSNNGHSKRSGKVGAQATSGSARPNGKESSDTHKGSVSDSCADQSKTQPKPTKQSQPLRPKKHTPKQTAGADAGSSATPVSGQVPRMPGKRDRAALQQIQPLQPLADGNSKPHSTTHPTINNNNSNGNNSPATAHKPAQKILHSPLVLSPVSTLSPPLLRKPHSQQVLPRQPSLQTNYNTRTRRLSVPFVTSTNINSDVPSQNTLSSSTRTSNDAVSAPSTDCPYAGATFQNSPAASALPIPMFSRSVDRESSPMNSSALRSPTFIDTSSGMYPNSHSSRSFGAISDTMLPAAMNSQQQQLPYSPTPRSPMSTWSSFSPNPTSALHPSDPETFIIEDGGYPCEDLRSKSRNLLAMLSASNHSRNEEEGPRSSCASQQHPMKSSIPYVSPPFHPLSQQQQQHHHHRQQQHIYSNQPYVHSNLPTSAEPFLYAIPSPIDAPTNVLSPMYQQQHMQNQHQQIQHQEHPFHQPPMHSYMAYQPHELHPVSLMAPAVAHHIPEYADLSRHLKHVLGLRCE
ncbi:hypothetical protein BASA50_006734 [Batrachochytrium salamandrivorans]|uniref:Uncharacterized protein n=1 Tax=Batrachochytrium salamandrivorans TaxID=1357716 RepID=A0ABQ8FC73_9FUNG|nr:hypothetical protein BASA62_001371 [Batrachochytrium salamandrivorans]KAH6594263.1 hypothetical protein BASA50_006734 [Batrachochytrium salamandrivorans]KAH9270056.1 hypothetical protein BASA83_007885 [Batrachochytrium salamandrivorans]